MRAIGFELCANDNGVTSLFDEDVHCEHAKLQSKMRWKLGVQNRTTALHNWANRLFFFTDPMVRLSFYPYNIPFQKTLITIYANFSIEFRSWELSDAPTGAYSCSGTRLTKAYDVTIQRYRNSHEKIGSSKMHILRCMDSKFCVKFQRSPLKFHTKFGTHTPQNMHFTRC